MFYPFQSLRDRIKFLPRGVSRRRSISTSALIICAHVLALSGPASAAVFQWDGGNPTGTNPTGSTWSVGLNWVSDTAPTSNAASQLEYGSVALSNSRTTSNNDIVASFDLNSITFNSAFEQSFTLTGSSIEVAGTSPQIIQNSSLAQALNLPIVLGSDLTLTGNGAGIVTIGGVISAGAASNVTKTGSSTYVLNAVNTYQGTTTVSAGTLRLGSGSRLHDNSDLTVNGGTFDLVTFNEAVDVVTLVSGTITSTTGILTGSVYNVESGTINAVLGGSGGGVNLNKTTAGTVTLNGANSYGGTTTVSAGTLQLGSSQRLANGSDLTVSGGTFDLQSFTEQVDVVTLVSGSIIGTGTAALQGASYNVQSGTIDVILGAASGTLTKTTGGTVTLNGVNTYTGMTTVSAGTLLIGANAPHNSAGALGNDNTAVLMGDTTGSANAALLTNGAFTVGRAITLRSGNTGVMTVGGNTAAASVYSGAITLGTTSGTTRNVNLVATSGGSVEFSGVINEGTSVNPSSVTIGSGTHTGTVKLSGTNQYGGVTTINGGTLEVTNLQPGGDGSSLGNSAGTASNLVISGATLRFIGGGGSSTNRAFTFDANGATLDANAAVTFAGGGGDLVASGIGNRTLSLIGSSTGGLGNVIPNPSSGSTSLTKNGSGTWTLSGANTYTGKTTVSGGKLSINAETRLGSNPTSFTADQLTLDGGTLLTTATLSFDDVHRGITLGASGGTFEVSTGTTLTVAASNIIAGAGGLTKTGPGTLTLNSANTYGGSTSINAGTLVANNAADSATGTGNVTVDSGATLAIGNGGAAGAVSGNITNNGTVEFNRSDETSHAGQISGSGVLTKSGAGTLTLSGNSSYSGSTNVNDGTLLVNGNNTGTGTVVVNEGATFGGTGGVAGAVTVNSGGTLSPGASIESLDTGALSFAAGSTFTYEIDSSASLSEAADLVNAFGSLSIATSGAGVTLAITDEPSSTPLPAGTKLTLISYDGSWDGSSIFAGYANETQFTLGANTFLIRYDDTSPGGNFVARTGLGVSYVTLSISAVPEASVILFGSLLLCGAVAFQRARTRWQLKVVEVRHG